MIYNKKLLLQITIPNFITHCLRRSLPKGVSKAKKSPYFKIGGNAFYSQILHHHERDFVVKEMHKYIQKFMPKNIVITDPIYVEFIYICPKNFGDISVRKDKVTNSYNICWKPYNSSYVPRWDVENLNSPWSKVIIDDLRGIITNGIKVSKGIIVDDTIDYVRKVSCEWVEEPDLYKREIIINIWQY